MGYADVCFKRIVYCESDKSIYRIKVIIMRRLKRIFAWILYGGLIGLVVGGLGGLLDRGSMMILVPSGSAFWAIVGGFLGMIAGALYGAISKLPTQNDHSANMDRRSDGSEMQKGE